VVISIVSLLSSVIFVSIQEGRAQARNAVKIQEVQQVRNAVELYRLESPTDFPGESNEAYQEGGSVDVNGNDYNDVVGELVSSGYLAAVPRSPSGDAYVYVNIGDTDALFFADLEVEGGSGGGVYGGRSGDQIEYIGSFADGLNTRTYQVVIYNGTYHESYWVSGLNRSSGSWLYHSLFADENQNNTNPYTLYPADDEVFSYRVEADGSCTDITAGNVPNVTCPSVSQEVWDGVAIWHSDLCPTSGLNMCELYEN